MCFFILCIFLILSCFFFFFFFQAEDGIRDLTVTGVQTCALPISPAVSSAADAASPNACRARRSSSRKRVTAETIRSEEHTSELQSQSNLVCRLLLEKKNKNYTPTFNAKTKTKRAER